MNRLIPLIAILSLVAKCEAFTPIAKIQTGHQSLSLHAFGVKTSLYSSSENNTEDNGGIEGNREKEAEKEVVEERTPTPVTDGLQKMSQSFTTEPKPQQRLDPLVASLTRMDKDMMNTPTTKVPLLGEIPLDGSIVVLLPVALIAIVGFIMSINIAFNSKDELVQKLDEINAVLSTPPVKQSVVNEGCRGLCSDQDEQLDNMRGFMNSLAPKK